jgi:2'-5' RNA ligase
MHRVFIAINLPGEIKKSLVKYQANWPELPIRWIKPENLHITLIFLGNLNDQETAEACKAVEEVAPKHTPFSVNLNKIYYGPPQKMPPRMVWVKGESSQELTNLKNDLEKALSERVNFRLENRAFIPHITLGRLRTWEWRGINPEERPTVDEEINLIFEANSVEVMESELKRGGAEYIILKSCSFQL